MEISEVFQDFSTTTQTKKSVAFSLCLDFGTFAEDSYCARCLVGRYTWTPLWAVTMKGQSSLRFSVAAHHKLDWGITSSTGMNCVCMITQMRWRHTTGLGCREDKRNQRHAANQGIYLKLTFCIISNQYIFRQSDPVIWNTGLYFYKV